MCKLVVYVRLPHWLDGVAHRLDARGVAAVRFLRACFMSCRLTVLGGRAGCALADERSARRSALSRRRRSVAGDRARAGVREAGRRESRAAVWYDNSRTSGGDGKSCRYELRVDGVSCPSGIIAGDVYRGAIGARSPSIRRLNHACLLPDNAHHPRVLVGYCDGLAAGAHTLQVFVQNSPNFAGSQCFTGWVDTGAATTLEALEIDHFEVIVCHQLRCTFALNADCNSCLASRTMVRSTTAITGQCKDARCSFTSARTRRRCGCCTRTICASGRRSVAAASASGSCTSMASAARQAPSVASSTRRLATTRWRRA